MFGLATETVVAVIAHTGVPKSQLVDHHTILILGLGKTQITLGLDLGVNLPAVPYIATDFHCDRGISSWTDPFQLNNGWLSGLADLDTESDYVRQRIVAYMADLISIGFSGFRMDAAKHIQPASIAAIFKLLKD